MSAQFRIPAEVVQGWLAVLQPHRAEVRGVDEVARELESALAKPQDEGHVALARHSMFSWAESLTGAATKLPLGPGDQARHVADDMRAYLNGRPPASFVQAPPPANTPTLVVPGQPPAAPAPSYGYVAPPPVVYSRAASPSAPSAGGTGAVRFFTSREIGPAVQEMLKDAKRELLVIAPWRPGIDTLVPALTDLAIRGVRVRVISRRPEPDDAEYHRNVLELQRRGVDLVMSAALHTRLVIQDDAALLVGAATLPPPMAPWHMETALATNDPASIAAARAHFERAHAEAKGLRSF